MKLRRAASVLTKYGDSPLGLFSIFKSAGMCGVDNLRPAWTLEYLESSILYKGDTLSLAPRRGADSYQKPVFHWMSLAAYAE